MARSKPSKQAVAKAQQKKEDKNKLLRLTHDLRTSIVVKVNPQPIIELN